MWRFLGPDVHFATVRAADHTHLEGTHDDSRHADDWLPAWRCATELLQEYHLKCGRRGGRHWFSVGRVGPSGTRPVRTLRSSQISTSTSSPVSECSWRKEVEFPYLIFFWFVSDDHWYLPTNSTSLREAIVKLKFILHRRVLEQMPFHQRMDSILYSFACNKMATTGRLTCSATRLFVS